MYSARPLLNVACFVCTFAGAAVVRADTLEDVQKKIHAKVSTMKSLEYTLDLKTEMTMQQVTIKSTTRQTAQFARKDDQVLARIETTSSTSQKMGDQEQSYDTKSTDVSDGKYWNNLVERMGQQMATRRKVNPENEPNPFNALLSFKLLAESFEIKLLPDETVDGKSAWVLETKPKEGVDPTNIMGRSLSYYDKETGLSIRGVNYDPNGKVVSTSVLTNVKINSDINPDRFVFKAPPGVTVMEQPDFNPPKP